MSFQILKKYLPENTDSFLKNWFSDYIIHIKITKNRNSKLGDYRKLLNKTHEITINSTLEPQLFFFVLTHELAHLISFEKYGRNIAPHGNEWKYVFGKMIIESLEVYEDKLKLILIKFSKSPKANFMSSADLVKYFYNENQDDTEVFIENLQKGNTFIYKSRKYLLEGLIKKNYLCLDLASGKRYSFRPLARVQKCS